MGNYLSNTIVGIGLNINQIVFAGDAPNPVSMRMCAGVEFNINDIFNKLLFNLNEYYHLLQANKWEQLDKEYNQNLFRRTGWHKFRRGREVIVAKILGINEFGKLILLEDNNFISEYGFKEVEFII